MTETAPAITEALLLAPELGFLDPERAGKAELSPDTEILGVPVIVRTLRQLQDAGVRQSQVVLDADSPLNPAALEAKLKADPRLSQTIRVHRAESGGVPAGLKTALGECDGPLFIARCDLVAPLALFSLLAKEIGPGERRLAVTTLPLAQGDRLLHVEDGSARLDSAAADWFRLTGLAVVGCDVVKPLATGEAGFDFLLTPPEDAPAPERVVVDHLWSNTVRTQADRPKTEHNLLLALRKPIDGFVARSINRRISIPISRRLASTAVTPNMASASTLVMALIAVWMVSHGGYLWMLLAAALFQFASIVDGVDGELARLKYQFSPYGEWMDTVIDDISNFSFFAGLTYAVYTGVAGEPWMAVCGFITLACYSCITPLMYSYIIKYTDSGDVMAIDFEFNQQQSLQDQRLGVRVLAFLKFLLKRDFFIFLIFCLAVLGKLPVMLVVTSVAAPPMLVALVIQHLKKRAELAK